MKSNFLFFLLFSIIPVAVYAEDYHPADTNHDWQISKDEVEAYDSAWKNTSSWPVGPNPILGTYVTRAAYLNSMSSCYGFSNANPPLCWDSDKDCDGAIDSVDLCPDDSHKVTAGVCGCGKSDSDDRDNDKMPDCADLCPDDPKKVKPGNCGCNQTELAGCPFTNSLGMTFIKINPDKFKMGSPANEDGRDSDETQQQVMISKIFYMQNTEVTQRQWKTVMENNPSYFSSCGDDCPVEQVSWDDVQIFIGKLNKMDDKTYRLPTEAEWEYAARAGTTTAFYNGVTSNTSYNCGADATLDKIAWHCGNSSGKTHPVAQKQANAWGLYDMSGNVWEWCSDIYENYTAKAVTDPVFTGTDLYRVLRGGSWDSIALNCRSANRGNFSQSSRLSHYGFRLACSPNFGK